MFRKNQVSQQYSRQEYQEIFNSDRTAFGGIGKYNPGPILAEKIPCHGEKYSIRVTVPPIGGLMLRRKQQ